MNTPQTVPAKERLWTPNFIKLFIINMGFQLCTYGMNTLASKFGYTLGAAMALIGIIASGHSVGSLVTKIIAAPAVDSFDRKKVLLFGLGFLTFVYAGYGLTRSAMMLTVFRILQGVGMAFVTLVTMTMATDALPEAHMGAGIGYFTLSITLMQSVAPSLGLFLFDRIGYNNTFWCMSALTVCNFLFACTLHNKEEEEREKPPFRLSLHSIIAPECLVVSAIVFLLSCTFACINGYMVLYADSMNVENVSLYFTVYALILLLVRPVVGRLSDQYGTYRVIFPCMLCYGLAFLVLSTARSLPMFLVAAGISSFGYGGMFPALQAACMKCVPKERRGSASSTLYVAVDLAQFFGPIMGSQIISATNSYPTMWRCMELFILAATGVALWQRKRIKEIDHL